jgi:hypothetical protein
MSPAIEISLCVLAWLIALNRGRKALLNQTWKHDQTAFLIGKASLFFALTMTFLVMPLSDAVNRLTWPNFSRLLAYSFVTVTLFLTTSSSLITFPIPQKLRHRSILKPYLLVTLGLLLISYIFFVSRTPEWVEQPIPATAGEMFFKLVMFTHAIVLCSIIALACAHYVSREKVAVTKYRIATISLTAVCGGAFFFTKSVLALGYLWHPLGNEWIHSLSKLLMVATAILWGGSFIHSKTYARVLAYFRGIRYWTAFQDLVYLVDRLEHLCPPVGMEMSRPDFWEYLRRSDYYLYRAMVHILDGKTLIADYLDDTIPVNKLLARWKTDSYLEATRVNTILREIKADEEYPEMISAYRQASRKLMQAYGRV